MFKNKYKRRYESLVNYLLTWQDMLIEDIKATNNLKNCDECRRDKLVKTSKDELYVVQTCLERVNLLNKYYS